MTTDTIKFIESARKHDFSDIELDIDKTEASIKKDGLSRLRAVIRDNDVNVVSLNAIDNYPIMTEDETTVSLKRAQTVIALCNDVDSGIIVVNPVNFDRGRELDTEKRFDQFIENVSLIAEKYGVRLGYEFVSYKNKVTNTLEKTVKGLEKWNAKVDLVLDVFHMYRSGETFNSLPQRFADRLLAFHVNDAPQIKIENLLDTDRVFPFDGVIDLRKYMGELRDKGFDGPVSVELFNQEYWAMNVDIVVQKAKKSLETLFER
jgi:2-keto-myo-inositol isomerase